MHKDKAKVTHELHEIIENFCQIDVPIDFKNNTAVFLPFSDGSCCFLVSPNFADFVESNRVLKSSWQFDVPSINDEEGIKKQI